MKPLRVVAISLVGLVSAISAADVVSDFETGTDDWLGVNVSFPGLVPLNTVVPSWTGHSITATEEGSGLFVLAGPSKFLGDQSAYLGGHVSFQLADAVSDGVPYPNLLLRGNGTVLYFETSAPGTSLTNFDIALTPTGWKDGTGAAATQAQFNSAFSNLDVFAVNADWKTSGTDSVELDNVRMASPVPEPATMAALSLGVGILLRRRSTRTKWKSLPFRFGKTGFKTNDLSDYQT